MSAYQTQQKHPMESALIFTEGDIRAQMHMSVLNVEGAVAGNFTFAKRSEKQKEQRKVGSEYIDRQLHRAHALKSPSKLKPKHIVVAWYEDRVADLLSSLANFAPENSTVTVVCKQKPEVSQLLSVPTSSYWGQ